MRRSLVGPLLLAAALRLLAIGVSDRSVADVERYAKMARHLLDVSWNPYQTKRLFPYPPPWAAVEAAAGWTARRTPVSFPTAVKLPVLAADLLIVALLAAAARERRAAAAAPWVYAAHPVAVLVGAVHGQFDALALAGVLISITALTEGRRDGSALALAAAIAIKGFPVLLLPLLAMHGRAVWRDVARYAALASLPVALLLLPFAWADRTALARELFAYSGVADFGWGGLARGVEWWMTGALPRSEARFWPLAGAASKLGFLVVWAVLTWALRTGRLRLGIESACLAILLGFLSLYGLLSAQYLLWAVPLGSLRPRSHAWVYAGAATAGLVGFYLFLAPGVLVAAPLSAWASVWAGRLWVAGVGATWAATLAWSWALLSPHPGRRAEPGL